MDVRKALWTVFILLMFLNLIQITQNFYLTQGLLNREAKIEALTGDLSELSIEYQASIDELSEKKEELTHAEARLVEAQQKIIALDQATEKKKRGVYTLGVTDGRGVALKLTVEVERGDGRLLADTKNVLLETDVQGAMRSAFLAAQNATGAEMRNADFIFTIANTLEENVVLTGGSAGAAMAIALVALVDDKKIRDDVVITGAITRDGRIMKVSQIEKKAEAAKNVGAKLLLVPKDQGAELDGIEVIEVANLSEAMKYLLY
jgi:predicted S18 family serine protease